MKQGPDLFGKVLKENYRVGELIGGGGFGWVYSGFDIKLERKVALKILQSQHGSYTEEQRERFLQEAKMTASLRSSTTVTLYDHGEYEEGGRSFLFMVMEYIEGQTLDAWIKKNGPMPALDCVHVMIQILSSLAEAHANAFIHRDLKAPNVMIFKDGFQGALGIKVLDYGIAKAFSDTRGWNHYTQTDSGLNLTPHYAAPEQLDPHAKLGPHTDLYTLGLVSYVCLTGRHPLDHMTEPMQVLAWLMGDEVCRLPKPEDKGPLAPIIHKLLLKNIDPKKGPVRYKSCAEVLADLKALETQEQRARREMATGPQAIVLGLEAAQEASEAQVELSQPDEPETLILANRVKEDEAYLLTQPAPDPELLYGFEDARTHVLKMPRPLDGSQSMEQATEPIPELVLPRSSWHPAQLIVAALVCMVLGILGVWVSASSSSSSSSPQQTASQEPSLGDEPKALPVAASPSMTPAAAVSDMGAPSLPVALRHDQSEEVSKVLDLGREPPPQEAKAPKVSAPAVSADAPPKKVAKSSSRPSSKAPKQEKVAAAATTAPDTTQAPKPTQEAKPVEVQTPQTKPKGELPRFKVESQPVEKKVWAVE